MEIGTILGLVGSLLGGGALGAVINGYFSSKTEDKKTDIEASDRIILQWEKLLLPLQQRVLLLEEQLENFRKRELTYLDRINSLETQLLLFESSHVDIPLPLWMKDNTGKMVFLNRMYEEMFLFPLNKTMNDYIGKHDKDIWSEEVASEFKKNDSYVIRTKKPYRGLEKIQDGSGGYFYVDVLKYPRMTSNNKVIGISGIILRESKNKEELL